MLLDSSFSVKKMSRPEQLQMMEQRRGFRLFGFEQAGGRGRAQCFFRPGRPLGRDSGRQKHLRVLEGDMKTMSKRPTVLMIPRWLRPEQELRPQRGLRGENPGDGPADEPVPLCGGPGQRHVRGLPTGRWATRGGTLKHGRGPYRIPGADPHHQVHPGRDFSRCRSF